MTQKDLQIGDWVYNHRKWECPILSIRRDYDSEQYYVMVIARHYGEEEFRVEDLSPIPLTPEILEKNGWEKTPTGYVFYTDGKKYDNSLWYIFDSNTFVVNTAEFQIKFVHQLQHALRLCGIEKEIIL